ncbi:helix-turn-helix domain-containing protein [Runella aurantiaca]|nr:response regulator transcription factor [Runella aurantiaca]
MKNTIGNGVIPIIDTSQLESELYQGGIPVSSLTANAHAVFHINRVEDYFRMVNFPLQSDLQPRRITVFNFFFLTKGTSSRSKGLDTYDFGENTFFFVPAYQITTHKFIRNDVEGFYCHFSLDLLTTDYKLKDLLNEFPFLEFNSHPLIVIKEEAKAFVIPLLERLLTEYKAGASCRYDILRTYLITLFTELKPFAASSAMVSSNAATTITEQYKKALSQHIYQKQKITDYAELLSVSPNHLNKCVKKTLGKSAHDLLNEMLLLEAKVLLKQTNLNVTEIAYRIGKNEISDFARFFKSQTGMKPSEYRLMS